MGNKVEYVVVDIETTGLNIKEDHILEVGLVFLNADLEPVDQIYTLITDGMVMATVKNMSEIARMDMKSGDPNFEWFSDKKFVHDMHAKSGLIDDLYKFAAQYYVDYATAEQMLVHKMNEHFLGGNRVKLPMMGSTVSFDRNFLQRYMPNLVDQFHHRNIDVSTFKVVVDKLLPKLRDLRNTQLKPAGQHRVISDCLDTVEEFKFYKGHIIDSAEFVLKSAFQWGDNDDSNV